MDKYSHPAFQVTGYKIITDSKNAFKDISEAWNKINAEKLMDQIEHKAYPGLHNVYFNYQNHQDLENRSYDVLIGYLTETGSIQSNPELTTITIPAQDYEYVTVKGDMPDSVVSKWNEINNMPASELKRSFGYDLDMYNEDGTQCTITVSVA
jgi:predicted transcriptional regulator YdeE